MISNKMLLGIREREGSDLIGVLDGFADYPEPGVWYLGLLLFAPRTRSFGIGKEVVEAFAAAAHARGARELQLNVIEQNQRGYRFWSGLGFKEMRRWRQLLGTRESTFIRMHRALDM